MMTQTRCRRRGLSLCAAGFVVAVHTLVSPAETWSAPVTRVEGIQLRAVHPNGLATRRAEAAEAEVVGPDDGKAALEDLEEALELQIQAASKEDNPERLKDLARLLVLAKTAEGIAVGQSSVEVGSQMQKAIAGGLADFVGKEDYDITDVTSEIKKRCNSAVEALDDVYFDDLARELDLAGQAAVVSFTGKEEYDFGDITKQIDQRAKTAVSAFTGKEDYKFGDITKEVMKRGGDAVKDFTGKEEYKFGDITKTILKNVFGGKDDKS